MRAEPYHQNEYEPIRADSSRFKPIYAILTFVFTLYLPSQQRFARSKIVEIETTLFFQNIFSKKITKIFCSHRSNTYSRILFEKNYNYDTHRYTFEKGWNWNCVFTQLSHFLFVIWYSYSLKIEICQKKKLGSKGLKNISHILYNRKWYSMSTSGNFQWS